MILGSHEESGHDSPSPFGNYNVPRAVKDVSPPHWAVLCISLTVMLSVTRQIFISYTFGAQQHYSLDVGSSHNSNPESSAVVLHP